MGILEKAVLQAKVEDKKKKGGEEKRETFGETQG